MNTMRRLLLAGLVVTLVAGCSLFEDDEDGDDGADPTATPVASPLPPVGAGGSIEADGKVVPVRHAALGFAVGGTVDEVLVEEGERVRKGQMLVRLEGGGQAAALLAAEADLRAAEAHLARVEADARDAAREAAAIRAAEVDRATEQGTTVDTEATAVAETRLARLEAEIEAARAGVDQAEARLEQAYVHTDQLALTAPFDGTVAAIDVAPAEVVMPGVAVLQLGDVSSWVIETENLTERDIVGIEAGDEALATFPAIDGLELAGTVDHVRPLGQPRLGDVVFTVVIRPDVHEPRLRWNMTAEVTIERPED